MEVPPACLLADEVLEIGSSALLEGLGLYLAASLKSEAKAPEIRDRGRRWGRGSSLFSKSAPRNAAGELCRSGSINRIIARIDNVCFLLAVCGPFSPLESNVAGLLQLSTSDIAPCDLLR